MNLLRKNAQAKFEASFPNDEINPNGSPLKLFKAFQLDTISGRAVCQRLQLPSDRLGSFLESGPPTNQEPVRRDGDGSPSDGDVVGNHRIKFVLVNAWWNSMIEDTGKTLFRELVAASGFDWSLVASLIIKQESVGYFHAGQLDDTNGMSFCLGGFGFMSSFWTTRRTGTCLESRGVIFTKEEAEFGVIMDNFAECEMECYSPLAVHFLLAGFQVNYLPTSISRCQSILSGVEKTTGIWADNPESILVDGHRIQGGITRILRLSKDIGNAALWINGFLVQLEEQVLVMLRHMEDLASHMPDNEKTKKVRDAEKEILDCVKVLSQQCRGMKATYNYLQHRAQLQKDMLFNFMTHEDSITNMEVADASRQLAHEARRDGSSMKTIAVLTMFFLPATFFSSLFSMPSFEDKQPDALTRIYWSYTVPVMAAVLTLWAAITQREAIRVLSRDLGKIVRGRSTRKSNSSSHLDPGSSA